MKLGKGMKNLSVLLTLTLILALSGIYIIRTSTNAQASAAEDEFVVVTSDYVDQEIGKANLKIQELTKKIEDMTKELEVQSKLSKFQVIELNLGEQLIAGDSAEIILRGGKATAIASVNGGLSDITSGNGKDILTGESIPLNHLLLVSRDDGRGLKATSKKVYLLFKGTYEIK